MREIKFRGKRVDNGKWVYGYLISPNRIMVWDKDVCMRSESYEVRPKTVGQFTGLPDKNGKDLDWWEGDLLLIPDQYTDAICDDGTGPTEDFNYIAPIVFENGSFGVNIQESGSWFSRGFISFVELFDERAIEEIVKIGNIHENPELLK